MNQNVFTPNKNRIVDNEPSLIKKSDAPLIYSNSTPDKPVGDQSQQSPEDLWQV